MKNKRMKKKETENRGIVRNSKSASDQIDILDARLGVGVGAVKERTRLNRIIESR